MKTIVIYKSKSGFTKIYAEWISQELLADIFEVSKVNIEMLKDYDNIIYGGGLYAVGINGVKFITENLNYLKDKKIVVFATGASPFREKVMVDVKYRNFTSEQQKYIKFFYMRGGFDQSKLKLIDKSLITLLKWKLKSKKKSELEPDEIGMLSVFDKPVDFTSKKNIYEIVSYINLPN